MTARVPRPEILARVPGAGHVVIEASAGTGKTYTLEHLVVDLLLTTDTTLGRLLVVTFTDRGARDLRGRIRATIESLLATSGGDEPAADAPCWVIDDEARGRLGRALEEFEEASISTIHSFCQRVLTEFSFDTRRLFEGEQVDGREAFARAFVDELRRVLGGGDPAREYVEAVLDAGTSTDDVLSFLYDCHRERGRLVPRHDPQRFEHALRSLPRPDELHELQNELTGRGVHPSTRKAVVKRVRRLSEIAEQLRGRAIRPVAALERFVDLSGRQRSGSVDPTTYLLEKLPADTPDGPVANTREAVLELQRCTTTPLGALAEVWLPRIEQTLLRNKRDRGQYDYDDMLLIVRDTLHGPSGPDLADALRARYDCALIDEFQDTDEVQWDIFRTLFFEGGGRLFLIGDPKQAIYGFRNADVYTYLEAREQVTETSGPRLDLDTNWRSSKAMVHACDAVLLDGDRQAFFDGGDIGYPTGMRCGRPELRAVDSDGEAVAPVTVLRITGDEPSAAHIRRGLYEAVALEIRHVVDHLRIDDGQAVRPLRHSDIHVLTRTNGEAVQVGRVLAEAGVPFAFFRQEGLMQSDEARDVLHLLQAILDPADRSVRLRAWLSPFFGLKLHEAETCADVDPDHPLMRRLLDLRALSDAGRFDRLFGELAAHTGFVGRLAFTRASERAVTNTTHVLEILLEESRRAPRTLSDLAGMLRRWIDRRAPAGEERDIQRLESERRAVQIMTMHKAKGLQAPVVFVAGGIGKARWGDGLAIHHIDGVRMAHVTGAPMTEATRRAIERERDLESRRLLYVAMTRAQVKLYLPYLGPAPPWADADPRASSHLPRWATAGYRLLNDRLADMFAGEGTDGLAALFGWREVPAGPGAIAAAAGGRAVGRWEPPAELLAAPPDTRTHHDRLKRDHAGFVVTSYSAMRTRRPVAADTEEPDVEFTAEASPAPEPSEDRLPGGLATGSFLHEVLEKVDFSVVRRHNDAASWGEEREVRDVLAQRARANGIDPRHLDRARDMVWAALTSPLRLGDDAVLEGGLATAGNVLKEMELIYPIPEDHHPLLGEPGGGDAAPPFSVRRGMIRGFVDLIFEHGSRVIFLDYKSDSLPDWDPATVAAHVEDHYLLQAQIYALGLVRMLRIRSESEYESRFGGLAYLFVRGMDDRGRGVYFDRPPFARIVEWERGLGARPYPTPGLSGGVW